jgi:hypothetical protein
MAAPMRMRMGLRATTGRHDRPEQGEKNGRRRHSGRLGYEKPFIHNGFEKNANQQSEQNNRENNRTITGAYQGDIRRQDRAAQLSPR